MRMRSPKRTHVGYTQITRSGRPCSRPGCRSQRISRAGRSSNCHRR